MSENHAISAIRDFEFIVKKYILPLLPTKGELKCSKIYKPISLKHCITIKGKTFRIYPCLKNPQIFFQIGSEVEKTALGAAKSVLSELMKVTKYTYDTPEFPSRSYYDLNINNKKSEEEYDATDYVYRINRYNLAFEVGLCNWLGGVSIFRLLDKMYMWSHKTYEGKKIPFSFIIEPNIKSSESCDYIDFLNTNHSAVFTDGISSGIILDASGNIIKYFSSVPSTIGKPPIAPYRFNDFARQCYAQRIGIISQSNGDILIFKGGKLVLSKRSGKWAYIDFDLITSRIKEHLPVEEDLKDTLSKEIFLSLLDVSFAHTGGCLAIIKEEDRSCVIERYINTDYLDKDFEEVDKDSDKDTCREKKKIIKHLIINGSDNSNRLFHKLDRKLRQDLLSLDGALVIDANGKILCSGAIVRIEGGSEDGGRTAAAKQLSYYGLAIKISMDGCIKIFQGTKIILEIF